MGFGVSRLGSALAVRLAARSAVGRSHAQRQDNRRAVAGVFVLVVASSVSVVATTRPACAQGPAAPEPAPTELGHAATTTGLAHEAVTTGQRGSAIPIDVGVQNDLAFDKLVLAYRPEGDAEFHKREMQPVGGGTYRAEIPPQATVGTNVSYYVEALDKEGAPVAGRASAQNPLVIVLEGSHPPVRVGRRPRAAAASDDAEDAEDDEAPTHPLYVALLVGTGAGWTQGNGDTNADAMLRPSTVELARLGQLAPEVGYWWSSALMISVQGRFQMVTGTNDVYANGRVYHTANYAAAAFLKATWLAGGAASVRPFFSLGAGGGVIRHVVTFPSLAMCGPRQDAVCVDTIAAGPVAMGPGGGVMADLGDGFVAILQVNTQLTFPAYSFNVDGNLGFGRRF